MYNGSSLMNQNTDGSSGHISKEHREFLEQVRRNRIYVRVTQIALLILFFVVWEAAARSGIIDPFITSQPSRMFKTFIGLHNNGSLYMHIGYTLAETIGGFVSGTILGIVIAIVLWWSEFIAQVLDPYLVVLNSLPKIALGPIILVWIGAGAPAIITMALIISLIVTIIGVYNGFKQVDEDKIKLLKTFGATKFQVMQKVMLPASISTIVSAMKINVGLAWVGVIVGEFLVSKAGLGYLIVYGGQVFKLDLVMTSVIILAVLAALMYQFVSWVEGKLVKWQ
ncbi:MAG: Hydroxymethylpyrimidine ABC transporter, transmembrane component [Firmicutes bacterium]|nr:Hydroxymethylpyrimidine ABC transporter, transmembrane component [Bacillota bacterium]MDI6706612.1 ABC transporter permease [Bacillota bacterium]